MIQIHIIILMDWRMYIVMNLVRIVDQDVVTVKDFVHIINNNACINIRILMQVISIK